MIGYDRVLQGIIGKSHTSFRILKAILQLSFYLIHFNQGKQKKQKYTVLVVSNRLTVILTYTYSIHNYSIQYAY